MKAGQIELQLVGAGFGGLAMAFQLRRAGVTDFLILERSDQIGGTWYDNSYPRAACDIPSPLYSFSFEQDFDWPRFYSGQADIHRYLRHCAEKHGLMQHVRLNSELRRATFDEQRGLWNPFRPADRDSIFHLAREQLTRSAGEVELARHTEESARRLLEALVTVEGYRTEVVFADDSYAGSGARESR